tara:strand:- start:108 stop:245 length:138 start_codon:yes stop_codon:yes gene_type:complete
MFLSPYNGFTAPSASLFLLLKGKPFSLVKLVFSSLLALLFLLVIS